MTVSWRPIPRYFTKASSVTSIGALCQKEDGQDGVFCIVRDGQLNKKKSIKATASLGQPSAAEALEVPLPWQVPKPIDEDPDAIVRIKAILENSAYLQADEDIAFLQSEDLRGVRLQLDFLKTEYGLRKHDIRHTIVVFGSTRIPKPFEAQRRADEALARLAEDPENTQLQRGQKNCATCRGKKPLLYNFQRLRGRL